MNVMRKMISFTTLGALFRHVWRKHSTANQPFVTSQNSRSIPSGLLTKYHNPGFFFCITDFEGPKNQRWWEAKLLVLTAGCKQRVKLTIFMRPVYTWGYFSVCVYIYICVKWLKWVRHQSCSSFLLMRFKWKLQCFWSHSAKRSWICA